MSILVLYRYPRVYRNCLCLHLSTKNELASRKVLPPSLLRGINPPCGSTNNAASTSQPKKGLAHRRQDFRKESTLGDTRLEDLKNQREHERTIAKR